MRLIVNSITGGGIAAFFFFSWIIQLLWNSLVAGHLGLAPALSYLQAAGLWFLVSLLFAWTGIGVRPRAWLGRPRWSDWGEIRRHIRRNVRSHISDWLKEEDEDVSDLGERIEAKIKRGFSRWVGAEENVEWDDLGALIEEKIKRKFQDWTEE